MVKPCFCRFILSIYILAIAIFPKNNIYATKRILSQGNYTNKQVKKLKVKNKGLEDSDITFIHQFRKWERFKNKIKKKYAYWDDEYLDYILGQTGGLYLHSKNSNSPRVLLLAGFPGIGKNTFIDDLREFLDDSNTNASKVNLTKLNNNDPFLPIGPLLAAGSPLKNGDSGIHHVLAFDEIQQHMAKSYLGLSMNQREEYLKAKDLWWDALGQGKIEYDRSVEVEKFHTNFFQTWDQWIKLKKDYDKHQNSNPKKQKSDDPIREQMDQEDPAVVGWNQANTDLFRKYKEVDNNLKDIITEAKILFPEFFNPEEISLEWEKLSSQWQGKSWNFFSLRLDQICKKQSLYYNRTIFIFMGNPTELMKKVLEPFQHESEFQFDTEKFREKAAEVMTQEEITKWFFYHILGPNSNEIEAFQSRFKSGHFQIILPPSLKLWHKAALGLIDIKYIEDINQILQNATHDYEVVKKVHIDKTLEDLIVRIGKAPRNGLRMMDSQLDRFGIWFAQLKYYLLQLDKNDRPDQLVLTFRSDPGQQNVGTLLVYTYPQSVLIEQLSYPISFPNYSEIQVLPNEPVGPSPLLAFQTAAYYFLLDQLLEVPDGNFKILEENSNLSISQIMNSKADQPEDIKLIFSEIILQYSPSTMQQLYSPDLPPSPLSAKTPQRVQISLEKLNNYFIDWYLALSRQFDLSILPQQVTEHPLFQLLYKSDYLNLLHQILNSKEKLTEQLRLTNDEKEALVHLFWTLAPTIQQWLIVSLEANQSIIENLQVKFLKKSEVNLNQFKENYFFKEHQMIIE